MSKHNYHSKHCTSVNKTDAKVADVAAGVTKGNQYLSLSNIANYGKDKRKVHGTEDRSPTG